MAFTREKMIPPIKIVNDDFSHVRKLFNFYEKNSSKKTFLVECLRSGTARGTASCKLQAPIKGGNFGAKLTHLCGF